MEVVKQIQGALNQWEESGRPPRGLKEGVWRHDVSEVTVLGVFVQLTGPWVPHVRRGKSSCSAGAE